MGMTLDKRLTRLEAAQRLRSGGKHFINIARYPWPLREDELAAWVAEQCQCACSPGCRGKRIGLLVPEKSSSPEAWAADVQRYYRDKAAGHEP
jgi:hypothetical protein